MRSYRDPEFLEKVEQRRPQTERTENGCNIKLFWAGDFEMETAIFQELIYTQND